MIHGVRAVVLRPSEPAVDRFGNIENRATVREYIDNVLVSPGATKDMEAARPEGVTVALTLHFPKEYTKSLEGCEVELPAPWSSVYSVVGNPLPYVEENTPTRWGRPVEVMSAHG